jgi:hypothetical protein
MLYAFPARLALRNGQRHARDGASVLELFAASREFDGRDGSKRLTGDAGRALSRSAACACPIIRLVDAL